MQEPRLKPAEKSTTERWEMGMGMGSSVTEVFYGKLVWSGGLVERG